MKIAEVIPDLLAGGAQVLCVSLAEELAKTNDVTLIVFHDETIPKFSLEKIDSHLRVVKLHKKNGIDLKFMITFIKFLRKLKPDVIHSHMDAIGYLLLFGFFKKTPIVHTIHTEPEHDVKPLFSSLLRKRLHSKRWNVSLIGISPKISLASQDFYRVNQITTIENGIVLPTTPDRGGIKKKYAFVSCGRMEKVKRFDLLITSFAKTDTSLGKLAIIGDGSEKEQLRSQVKKEGIADRVDFLGQLENPYGVFFESSIFVLVSSYEGYPITILEAMSCGLPILATNVGGVSDVVKSGVNGALMSPEITPDGVAIEMERMYKDKKSLNLFGSNSLKLSASFSISVCADRYFHFFLTLAKRAN